MQIPRFRRPDGPGKAAIALGLANAAVSAYWLLGGTGLLDTVGGEIERWGRERGTLVVLGLAAVVAVKTAIAVVPLVNVTEVVGCWARRLGWVAAVVLVLYGGLLTVVGLLVQVGVIDAAAEADTKALAWHTFFWDPWFFIWGIALVLHLRRTSLDSDSGFAD